MTDSVRSSNPRQHPSVIWSRLKPRWPFLIWLVAALLIVLLLFRQGGARALSGVIEKQVTEISPLETAVIKKVLVLPGQAVKQGDVLVVLDSSVMDAKVAAAESARKLAGRQAKRQFESTRFQAEVDLNALIISRAQDEAELNVLADEVARLESLFQRRLVDGQSLTSLRARKDALQAAVEAYPAAVEQLEKYITWATEEKAALLKDLEVDTSRSLALRKNHYQLLAGHDGVISQVFHSPGEVLDVGEVVLTIVREQSQRVIALLPEERALEVEIGQTYIVKSRLAGGKGVSAQVISLSPEIIGLPQQSMLIPGRVIRGRRIMLEIVGEHSFLPGEAVQLLSARSLWPRTSIAKEPQS